MTENSLPWPQKGDQLFSESEDHWHEACLNYLHDDWTLYADGYQHAGDLLVEQIKGKRNAQLDILVFPIVFLYRQHIELRLKEIIQDGNKLLNIHQGVPRHHKINELWNQCRKITERVHPQSPIDELDAVEKCINEFAMIDPSSQAFRYPIDTGGNPSLPSLNYIDLVHLSEVMSKIAMLLNGISMGISVYLQQMG